MFSLFRAGASAASLFFLTGSAAVGQAITRVDPTNWWVGMKTTELQLVVYGPQIGTTDASLAPYPGVTLTGADKPTNPNYQLLYFNVAAAAKPGKLQLRFKGKKSVSYAYELKARRDPKTTGAGVTAADVVYLIMPDRFANGDPKNDVVATTQQPRFSRDSLRSRHGGDIAGVRQHLDYLQDLGVTTLWLTPVVENDQPKESYHGYAFTDHYRVDPRLGTLAEYVGLVDDCHKRGLKVIHDVVLNHVGNRHYLFRDAPDKSWFHQWPTFTRTTYRDPVLTDPYAAQADKQRMTDGWFDTHMPDFNQQNPAVARYLTQNNIWWIETTGIDGYRLDTYAYSDLAFEKKWGEAVLTEYPNLGMFGETWVQGIVNQAYFAQNTLASPPGGFRSNLPGVTDFQLQYAINEALTREPGWTEGIMRIYYTLQADFLYQDPLRNCVFLDNHDISRFYSNLGGNPVKLKTALAWLLTTRGIPQLYYGTEIGMKNSVRPDGKDRGDLQVREDFPGGWAGDARNAFTAAGRSAEENDLFNYTKRLLAFRKAHPELQLGKLMQFVPQDGQYVYFRYDEKTGAAVMVLMNGTSKDATVKLDRFAERLVGFKGGEDAVSGEKLTFGETLAVPAWGVRVVGLGK
ncbi:MAG: glycoside hydrolase family 13 protein [Hymenobacteraceae bacterium]|nr:glycoside hydrolase family 13 protein [Hymenobacteraceae bacterium]